TCKAEGISCCPTDYKGCVDARKLLLHYRRCRDIRSRKASGGQGKSEPHFCLVCSLVARNAKAKGRSVSPIASKPRKQLMPSANDRCTPVSQPQKQQLHKQELRVRPTSFSFSEMGRTCAKPLIPKGLFKTMPPPPPRFSLPSQPGASSNIQPEVLITSALAVHPSEQRDQPTNNARPRAGSLDLRKSRFMQPPSSNEEEDLDEQPTVGKDGFQVPILRRRRSASFHVVSSVTPNGFQTIEEDPVGEDLQEILEGDR
ncbi:MAG: hypothetical protein SGBAC_012745, partial [Bacillariaceae sp.]